jgi:hypothetical protein
MAQVTPTTQESSIRYGQKYDPQTGIGETFTEQDIQVGLITPLLGNANTEITPTDRNSSLVRTVTIPSTAILAFHRSWAETSAIDLPPTLTSLTMVYENNTGEGDSSETATGASVGSNPNLSIALNGTSQSSASLIPDLQVVIQDHAIADAPVQKYIFYAIEGDTMADILTRLTALAGASVLAWPKFDQSKRPAVFTLKGQQASIAAGVTAKQTVSLGGTNTFIASTGTSNSTQLGNSLKTINVPPTIHGTISIASNTSSQDIDADAAIVINSATNWPAISVSKSATATVAASVTPTSTAATSPISAIPANGLYLYKLNGELSPYSGFSTQYAIVFDFSNAS